MSIPISDEEILTALHQSTIDAHQLQLQTLTTILTQNPSPPTTKYHDQPINTHNFTDLVPLSDYPDYSDLIQRIADGVESPSALSSDPLICFFYSSGTSTMRPKMIPFFDSGPAKASSELAHRASSAILRRIVASNTLRHGVLEVGEKEEETQTASEDNNKYKIINHEIEEDTLQRIRNAMEGFFDLPLQQKKNYSMAPDDIEGYGQGYVVSDEQKLDWNDLIFLMTLPAETRNMKYWPTMVFDFTLIPPRPLVNKILWFLYAGNVNETKGGFKVMAATAYAFQRKGSGSSPVFKVCVSPPEVILGSDPRQQTYCHLLCGLKNSNSIDGIRAPYAAGLVRALRFLKSTWEQLCQDIETGIISTEITEKELRDVVEKVLGGPRPDIAKSIRKCCGKENWEGILSELWPDLRYIACVTTGSMEQYYSILKYYAGEKVQVLGGDYFASECSIGINMDRARPPESTSFVLLPSSAYFEFLPYEIGSSSHAIETVDISGVKIGKLYEVVVTTYRGLYRYRLGDIVKIVGFFNQSPRLEFVARAPKGESEVFTERELMSAMEKCNQLLKNEELGEVVEFGAVLDEHLVVFAETSEGCKLEPSDSVLKMWCSFLEDSLGSVYKMKREIGELGPVEICVVSAGSFEGLARLAVESGSPSNQYKPPKILRNQSLVDFLKGSVLTKVSL